MDNNTNPNSSSPDFPPSSAPDSYSSQPSQSTPAPEPPNIPNSSTFPPVAPQKSHTARALIITISIIAAVLLIAGIAIGIIFNLIKTNSPLAEVKVGDLTAKYAPYIWSESNDKSKTEYIIADGITLESVYGTLTFGRIQLLDDDLKNSIYAAIFSSEYIAEGLQEDTSISNPSAITTVEYGNVKWAYFTGLFLPNSTKGGFWIYYDKYNSHDTYVIAYQTYGSYEGSLSYAQDVLSTINIATPIDGALSNGPSVNNTPTATKNALVGGWEWTDSDDDYGGYYDIRSDNTVTIYTSQTNRYDNYIEGTYTTDPSQGTYGSKCENGYYIKITASKMIEDGQPTSYTLQNSNEYCIIPDSDFYTMYNLRTYNTYYGTKVK